jgi:YVTN family beta-propeller protein
VLLFGLALASALALALPLARGAEAASASREAREARADGGAPDLAYIAGGGANADELDVVDIAGKNVTARIAVRGKPRGVVLSYDNRYAYVTQSASNSIAVVDAQAKSVSATIPVGTQPTSLAMDIAASGNLLIVANTGSDSISIADSDAHRVLYTIPVGRTPTAVAVAYPGSGIQQLNGAELWVASSGSDSVTVLDDTSRKVIATIPVADGPESLVIPQNGGSAGVAYVGTHSGAVVAIRLADHQVLGTLLQLAGPPGQMDYNATNGQLYIPDPSGGVVQVLRPAAPGSAGSSPSLPAEPLRTLPFSGAPAAVAIPNDGSYAFVAGRANGQVAMYDLAQRRTVATLDVGGAPAAMVTGSYPPLVSQGVGTVVDVILTIAVLGVLGLVAYLFIRADRKRQAQQGAPTAASPQDEDMSQEGIDR